MKADHSPNRISEKERLAIGQPVRPKTAMPCPTCDGEGKVVARATTGSFALRCHDCAGRQWVPRR